MATSETSYTFTRKAEARRFSKRMRDHGLLTKARYDRGNSEITILVPERFQLSAIHKLAIRLMAEVA